MGVGHQRCWLGRRPLTAYLDIIYCLGAYLVFIKFRLIKFTLFWQIVVEIVGFFGLLTILYGMNYTQPFSIGGTVSGLATQIEARVPGKVIEVNVKDNASVKKGDVLFRMDPQPYADELSHAQATYAEDQIKTSTAILQATQTVNAANAQVQAIKAEILATQSSIAAEQSHLDLKKTRLTEYTELKSKNAGSAFEVEKYETDVQSATDQLAAQPAISRTTATTDCRSGPAGSSSDRVARSHQNSAGSSGGRESASNA